MKKIICFILSMLFVFSAVAFAEGSETIYSVTTGLPTEKTAQKLVAVQFDNEFKARPQLNLTEADVIYECEVYNGGYTRYTAIFNDTIPELVEAVRSARIMHIDIALDWDATLVHFGGQQMEGSSIYDYVQNVNIAGRFDGIRDGNNFYRDTQRAAPNNVIAKLAQIYEQIDDEKASKHSPMIFSDTDYTKKGEACSIFRVNYNVEYSYYPSYQFEPEKGLYHRYYCRQDMVDGNGEEYYFSNVIVMQADYSWYDGSSDRPIVALTGTNKCDYFIDGRHFTGSWVRNSVSESTTFYDEEGNIVVFKPGKTFIQVIKKAEKLEIAE